MRVAQIRVLGGAMARVPADATAFAHRSSRIMVNVAAFYDGPDDQAAKEAWVTGVRGDLEQEDHGAYVNFITDEGEERVRAAYPGATWDRLVAIKTRYDPTNLFSRNQNIPPASSAAPAGQTVGGNPSCGKSSGPNVVISAIRPSTTRRTSSLNGRWIVSPGARR